MIAELLMQTIRGFDEDLARLREVLGSAAGRLFVYYICPLTNLRQIAATGILPYATAPQNRTDLSGQSVQARREISVLLTDRKQVSAHQCINLFWNPLNWTMRAFQRNGLLRELSSENSDDAVVCVCEIDLEQLILDPRCNWTVAPQNLAGTGFASFSREYITGEATWEDGSPRCDWRSIFSIEQPADRTSNRKRSAELIVHLGQNEQGIGSVALPFDMVSRIIVPADDVRTLTQDQNVFLTSTGKTITRLSSVNGITVYFTKDELLKAEKRFLESLQRRRAKKDADVLQKMNAALSALERFEAEHPELSPKRERFLCPELADAYHGSLHSARVMFWSAFLAQHFDEPMKLELLPVVLAAASIHDTYRVVNTEDETHGMLAAEAHRTNIESLPLNLQLRSSCLNAVQFHCIPDDRCPNLDLALQILKDADALDRGRFAPPNKQGGCDTKFLRMDILKEDKYGNIAWMAHWAAQITRYTPFGACPCADFSRSLCDAVNSLSTKRA